MGETLRKLAAKLREDDAAIKTAKAEKCAHVLRAGVGLSLLKQKLGVR